MAKAFNHVRLAFYKAPGTLNDKLIRWGSGHPYSHVELIGPDGRGWSASAREGNVRKKEINFDSGNWDIVDMPWKNGDVVAQRMEEFMGQKYDYWGLFLTHVIRVNRSVPDRWICSEVVARCLGLPDAHEFSPGSLANIVKHYSTFQQSLLPKPQSTKEI
jgi:hypothetical protein